MPSPEPETKTSTATAEPHVALYPTAGRRDIVLYSNTEHTGIMGPPYSITMAPGSQTVVPLYEFNSNDSRNLNLGT